MNLNHSQIPSEIDTVEKLAAWCGLLLHRGNSSLKVMTSPGITDYVTQASIYTADDQTERLVVRLDIELQTAYAASGAKIWTQVKPFSELAIPAAYAES